jgi:hypothetical protein
VILTKFHNFDVWQNFLKTYENLRPFYKKSFYEILSGFLLSQKELKKIFFKYGEWVCFKKCKVDLSKKCQKTVLPIEKLDKTQVYKAKLFLCALFTKSVCTFCEQKIPKCKQPLNIS